MCGLDRADRELWELKPDEAGRAARFVPEPAGRESAAGEPAIVGISIVWAGASAQMIEYESVIPIEEALATGDDVRAITARIDEGHAMVTVELAGADPLDGGTVAVRAAVTAALPRLPPDVMSQVIVRGDRAPVLWLAVRGQQASLLSDLARYVIQPRLERLAGVAQIDVAGAVETVVAIRPDLARLAALGVTLGDLRAAVTARVLDLPAGRLDATSGKLRVDVITVPDALADLPAIVIQHGAAPLRLVDVAKIEELVEGPASSDGLMLGVRPQSGADPVRVVTAVRAEIGGLRAASPPGVTIAETAAPASAPRPAAPLVVWLHGADSSPCRPRSRTRSSATCAPPGSPILFATPPWAPRRSPSTSTTGRGADLGVNPSDATAALRALVGGERLGRITVGGHLRAHATRRDRPRRPGEGARPGSGPRRTGRAGPAVLHCARHHRRRAGDRRHDRERAIGVSIYATGAALATARARVAATTSWRPPPGMPFRCRPSANADQLAPSP